MVSPLIEMHSFSGKRGHFTFGVIVAVFHFRFPLAGLTAPICRRGAFYGEEVGPVEKAVGPPIAMALLGPESFRPVS